MISEELKELVRLAMQSHNHCGHDDLTLCNMLTLIEVQIRYDEELTEEETIGCQNYVADQILESMILKGYMAPAGIDIETGDFLLEFTEAGEEAYNRALEHYNQGNKKEEME